MRTLQVPYHANMTAVRRIVSRLPEKNVLQSASRGTRNAVPDAENRVPASLTIEAALCLPLFVFLALALAEPMLWLDRQRKVQTAVEAAAEQASIALYLRTLYEISEEEENTGEDGDTDDAAGVGTSTGTDGTQSAWLLRGISAAGAGLFVREKAGKYAEDLTVRYASFFDSDGMVRFGVSYPEKVPFFEGSGGKVTMHAGARRRPWTGNDGKLRVSRAGAEGNSVDSDTVYVGANMGRYHRYRDCHYISNEYRTLSAADIKNERNQEGRRYRSCRRCVREDHLPAELYVTAGGECYHADKNCSAMASYVREVPLSEVEWLGACSYCEKRGAET